MPEPTPQQAKILRLKKRHPRITTREIAAILGTTPTNVTALLRYKPTGKPVGRPRKVKP